jgi:hypothetical protein
MRRFAPPLLATLAAAVALAACGSSSAPSTGASSSSRAPTATGAGALAPSAHAAQHDCPALVARTLGSVAQRIYDAALHGNVVGQAVHRVEGSKALANAVSANDAPAASAALRSLLAGQIAVVQVIKGGKLFASVNAGRDAGVNSRVAIAPVGGHVKGTGVPFVLSTQTVGSYLKVTQQVTGADLVLLTGTKGIGARIASTVATTKLPAELPARGPVEVGGRKLQAYTLPATFFPSFPIRIVMLIAPTDGTSCRKTSPERTASETLGHVGERIYQEEAGSPSVRATLRHIEADSGFQHAVAARDTAAIRAAIVRFFGEHIHVVRVRVYAVEPSGAQRFLYDLGGPYVLAPVHGVVRSAGKLVGRFSFAIQDDAGYLRLARLFTGAEVLMRVGSKQVAGTLAPGPARVPDHGTIDYRGKTYEAYSFTGEAFPSGALRISLLIPKR